MSGSDSEYREIRFLRRLHPDLPETEMRDAEERYRRYLELRLRIFERLEREAANNPHGDLTDDGSYGIDSYEDV